MPIVRIDDNTLENRTPILKSDILAERDMLLQDIKDIEKRITEIDDKLKLFEKKVG